MKLIKRIPFLFLFGQRNAATPISTIVAAAANHVLSRQPWALERLRPYAHYQISVQIAALQLRFMLQESGALSAQTAESETRIDANTNVDVAITLPLSTLCKALLPGSSGFSNLPGIAIRGDAQCAQALSSVLEQVRWDVEEDLSTVVGDIFAHRIVHQMRAGKTWIQQQASRVIESATDYYVDEHPQMVRRHALTTFQSTLLPLQQATEHLDKRIARLEKLASRKNNA